MGNKGFYEVVASQWSARFFLHILNAHLLEEVHVGRLKTKSTIPSKWESAPEVTAALSSDLHGNYSWAAELLRNYLSVKLLMMLFDDDAGPLGPGCHRVLKWRSLLSPQLCVRLREGRKAEERVAGFCAPPSWCVGTSWSFICYSCQYNLAKEKREHWAQCAYDLPNGLIHSRFCWKLLRGKYLWALHASWGGVCTVCVQPQVS